MVVDLDAFDANAADLARRAGGKPIRLASKSVRVPALIERALAAPGFHGVLGYTLREALWLEQQGITDDIVIAYPTVDRAALARAGRLALGCEPDHADGRRRRPARRGRLGPVLARRPGARRARHRRRAADGRPARRPQAVTAARRRRTSCGWPGTSPSGPGSRWSA